MRAASCAGWSAIGGRAGPLRDHRGEIGTGTLAILLPMAALIFLQAVGALQPHHHMGSQAVLELHLDLLIAPLMVIRVTWGSAGDALPDGGRITAQSTALAMAGGRGERRTGGRRIVTRGVTAAPTAAMTGSHGRPSDVPADHLYSPTGYTSLYLLMLFSSHYLVLLHEP